MKRIAIVMALALAAVILSAVAAKAVTGPPDVFMHW